MAKDEKTILQMCGVMKHMFIPKDEIIFDYENQGDLFYMVISGKCSCKVPYSKQVIFLSEDEKALFELDYFEDIISISDAD